MSVSQVPRRPTVSRGNTLLSPYLPDGDEQDPLRRWPIGRDADTPAPDLNAAGCELLDALSDRLAQVGRRTYASGRDVVLRGERDRRRATGDRECAAAERTLAAENRAQAAADRLRAAGDRQAAIAEARARFGAVQQALGGDGIAISVGCAELAARDDAAGLIDRAGADRRSSGERDPAPVDAEIGAQPC